MIHSSLQNNPPLLLVNLYASYMPKTVPSTVFFIHDGNEIDASGFQRDMIGIQIEKHCPLHGTPFHGSKSLKGMSMALVSTQLYFYKNKESIFLCNNIELSSFDGIIGSNDFVSLLLEILES